MQVVDATRSSQNGADSSQNSVDDNAQVVFSLVSHDFSLPVSFTLIFYHGYLGFSRIIFFSRQAEMISSFELHRLSISPLFQASLISVLSRHSAD